MIRKGLCALFSVTVVLVLCAFFYPASSGTDGFLAEGAVFSGTDAPETEEEIKISVFLSEEEGIVNMPLEEYVAGVIAAEMPDSYEKEALKAQAVAARTFAVFKSRLNSREGCVSHKGADVCSSSGCCQGYVRASRKEFPNAVKAAEETAGVIALFHARPIRALYHASSGGHTENAENVYSEALAYLRGVPSPGEDGYSRFQTDLALTLEDLRAFFLSDADVLFLDTLPLSEQLEILSRSESGRVTNIRTGLTSMSGNDFRRKVGLKSTLFEMEFTDDGVIFHSTGYGHGVGMSQTGANAMAKNGSAYDEILTHYYTGIELAALESWLGSG